VTDLRTSGFDHAMLGHFHTPRDHDLYTYPGNPDALTFGEVDPEGCERGAVVLEWSAASSIPERTRHRVGMSRMHDIRVDLTGSSSMQQIRERIGGALEGLTGSVRLILAGEVSQDVDLQPGALKDLFRLLDGVQLSMSGVRIAYDLDAIERDEADTVRGRFLQIVRGADLTPEERQRVVVVGLRALDGRSDLEVP
jgi:DNA repair exonuclease SbcCD nuclease subunit